MVAGSRQKRPGARKKKITIVSPSSEGAKKKMGSPEPTDVQFAGLQRRFGPGASRHRGSCSPSCGHAVAGGKGRPNLPHAGERASPTTVACFFGRRSIGICSTNRIRYPPPLGIAELPLGDRTALEINFLRSYGALASIIGHMKSGWQTNSGSLVFEVRLVAWWPGLAKSGQGHGRKKSR